MVTVNQISFGGWVPTIFGVVGRLVNSLAVCVILGVPVIALAAALVWLDRVPETLKPEPIMHTASLSFTEQTDSVEVSIALTPRTPPQLTAPNWSGIVQKIFLQPGDPVKHGDPVALIDGVVTTAWMTPLPFYRELNEGSEGDDVAMLQEILVSQGYDLEVSGNFDTQTGIAMQAWRERLGDQNPSNEFSPATIVWLPGPDIVASQIQLDPGKPVPEVGSTIVVGESLGYSAVVTRAGSGIALTQDLDGYQLAVGSLSLGELPSDGLTDIQISQIIDSLQEEVVGREDEFAEAKRESPSEGDGVIEVTGELALLDPVSLLTAPASAAVQDAKGKTCVYSINEGTTKPINVEIVGGDIGVVYIAGDLSVDETVILNPVEVMGSSECRP